MPANNPSSAQVFISYSHKDKEWLDRLNVHLAPIKRNHSIIIWDDTTLKPGMQWDAEIKKALGSIQAAILLLSADFLASEYIYNEELPTILEAAAKKGATILSVIISPCLLSSVPKLAAIQTVNNPKSPLINLRSGKREEVFVKVAEQVVSLLAQQAVVIPAKKPPKNTVIRLNIDDSDATGINEALEDILPEKTPVTKTAALLNRKNNTEQIKQQFQLFNGNPKRNRFLIVSVGEVYVQFANYDDGEDILFEAVSNKFLKEKKLSASQMQDLLSVGFTQPDKDNPNFYMYCDLNTKNAVKDLVALAVVILFDIYGLPEDSMLSFEHGNSF